MRSDADITNFTAGELSPRMKGRVDHKDYYNGCDTCLNFVIMPQGGATARPGTFFAAKNKSQSTIARLVPFIFSTLQAYQLEFSDQNVRVYMNRGVVLTMGTPVDIAVPYRTADLKALKFTQSADTLFITHPSYPPATLTRSSHIAWTYAAIVFKDGPYLDENSTDTTVTPSGTTGSITLTFSATTGINGGAGFSDPADVGRLVRVRLFSLWAWCQITAVSSTTVVTATVQAKVNNGAAAGVDGATWVAQTDYVAGATVKNGSDYFIAVVGGRSSSANGPNGQGSRILDGTVMWSGISARDNQAYVHSTFYEANDVIKNGANFYQCTVGGKTDSGGSGPTGTGGAITDGDAVFSYLAPFTWPTATKNWALGAWSKGTGYPAAVRFWQQRLFFAGCTSYPSRIDGSQTGDFINFAATKSDGTVIASNAVSWTIDDDQVNAIKWLIGAGSAQAMQLGMGTSAGETVLQAASSAQSLSPTSVQAYSETAYGSADDVNPLRIGKSVLFADRTGRKLREWSFFWQSNGYIGPDKLQLSEHISRAADGSDPSLSGLAELAYQQSPHQVVWARRNDGALLSFTYDREQEVFAPARHQLGGNYYGAAPVVESLSVIPSQDGTYDELWLSVLRTIGGTATRTIEVMAPYFDGGEKDTAFFVDCGLTSDLTEPSGTLSVTGLTNANVATPTLPVKFTGTAALVSNVDAFTDAGAIVRVNGGKIVVTAVTDARHATGTALTALQSLAPAASGAWSCTAVQDSFSGLDHLNGETVAIWGDGADLDTATVVAGDVAMPNDVSFAAIGLPNIPVLVTMPWEPQRAAAATSQGKMKKVQQLYARFHETRGAQFGRRITDPSTGAIEEKLSPMEDRQGADLMDNAPPLQSGIYTLLPGGGYDREGQCAFTRKGAGPMTIIGIFARGDVSEMPGP